MKILLCKASIRKFFDCLVKFWTLLYGSKTRCSNSQKVNFIGFKQGQFWSPYMCAFHLAYAHAPLCPPMPQVTNRGAHSLKQQSNQLTNHMISGLNGLNNYFWQALKAEHSKWLYMNEILFLVKVSSPICDISFTSLAERLRWSRLIIWTPLIVFKSLKWLSAPLVSAIEGWWPLSST